MADQAHVQRAVQVFVVVAMFAALVWTNTQQAGASQSSADCSSTDFSVAVEQTIPINVWGGGFGVMHVTISGPGAVSVYQDYRGRERAGSGEFDSAGTHGLDLQAPFGKTEPTVVEYEATFTPAGGGADSTCTTSLEWLPANDPAPVVDCSFTVQLTCYERQLTLSINVKKNVYSGKIVEPAGGTLCSGRPDELAYVFLQKKQSDGTWQTLGLITGVENGAYSKKLSVAVAARAGRHGTFRAWLDKSRSPSDDYWCSQAFSAPVKVKR